MDEQPKRSRGRPTGSGAGLTEKHTFRVDPDLKAKLLLCGDDWARAVLQRAKAKPKPPKLE